ncbi:hypothetical protein QLX56_13415 (plasmid) [Enterococcus faecium]|uniref:Uncharacterized protein n=1 Tax=Enterococcus faecium TaxID=1352 RepID=A0AAI8PZU0_ENTFC|nr:MULTISPECIES: hypothetical protein [Enterococcus]AII40742.1 hypothetical protein M395_13365 [Enterococcus faecium T110]AYM74315.1 hypothetical protein D9Z05_13855 [Enterococcus faecium]MBL5007184.1 hypothetical protein [Enterococcus lactis]MDO2411280.1 hypothetical protein [Enterococcus faecium]QPB63712.1 hypothetical protein GFB66_13525 [Enterococcus faecium]
MKKVYQKCLWISYITLGIAVNEMGENINHDSNTNIKAFLIRFWLKISTKQEESVSIIAYTFS